MVRRRDTDPLGDGDGEVVVDVVEVVHDTLAYVPVFDLAELEAERGDDVLALPVAHAVPEQRGLGVVVGEARAALAELLPGDVLGVVDVPAAVPCQGRAAAAEG